MDEFNQLAEDLESLYATAEMIRDRHNLSGITIDCYGQFDQFQAVRGNRRYIGRRQFRNHRKTKGVKFEKIK